MHDQGHYTIDMSDLKTPARSCRQQSVNFQHPRNNNIVWKKTCVIWFVIATTFSLTDLFVLLAQIYSALQVILMSSLCPNLYLLSIPGGWSGNQGGKAI